jgi:hypothetical protein
VGQRSVPHRQFTRLYLIAMMQTADFGEGNNIAGGGKLHATRPWAVLVETCAACSRCAKLSCSQEFFDCRELPDALCGCSRTLTK